MIILLVVVECYYSVEFILMIEGYNNEGSEKNNKPSQSNEQLRLLPTFLKHEKGRIIINSSFAMYQDVTKEFEEYLKLTVKKEYYFPSFLSERINSAIYILVDAGTDVTEDWNNYIKSVNT